VHQKFSAKTNSRSCYTNHALDQFLQHAQAAGIDRIIRIGGRSRSTALDHCNLVEISRAMPKSKYESYTLGKAYSNLEMQQESLGKRLAGLHNLQKSTPATTLARFLMRDCRQIHDQFFPGHDDGFTLVGDPIANWLGRGWGSRDTSSPASAEYLEDLRNRASLDVNSLSSLERDYLYQSWLDSMRKEQTEALFEEIEHTERQRSVIKEVHSEVNRRALLGAKVIGITTTGLARDVAMLRHVRIKVVICEEAGEVLEPHIISALLPGVEHVIQIGDHEQLRPQITCRSLSVESPSGSLYQFDRSQFERLATGQPGLAPLPVSQLNVQRRMRPQISELIRQTIYQRLEDHDTVKEFANVVGMRKNVFWLTHNHVEDAPSDDKRLKSYGNDWEVHMAVALVRHLVRQGVYKGDDIAVLTPYARQLQQLRSSLARDFEVFLSEKDEEVLAQDGDYEDNDETSAHFERMKLGDKIRLATVDNFQGEEAKVVVVSLVRSNDRRKVGFLKTSNRINVLLSRAQHGLYLIGNSGTYSNVPMWTDVLNQLEASNSIGKEIELCCPRHVDTPIRCSEPGDFARFSPDGGCDLPCDRRLDPCGHQCPARCHSEVHHSAFPCIQPCPRIRMTCAHSCPKLCGESCGHCKVRVNDVLLRCGHHADNIPCFQTQCISSISCEFVVQKDVPGCSHKVDVACAVDVTAEKYKCPVPCPGVLPCGHQCTGSCSTCSIDNDGIAMHQACSQVCGRPYDTCGHVCRSRCHSGTPCSPCTRPCEVRCPLWCSCILPLCCCVLIRQSDPLRSFALCSALSQAMSSVH
jgi:hypothetical protein